MIQMTKKRKEAWRKTLIMWERISIIPEGTKKDKKKSLSDFKLEILKSLGLRTEPILFECPLCQAYFGDYFDEAKRCKNCPIGIVTKMSVGCKSSTPYKFYVEAFLGSNKHPTKEADAFYMYLVVLAKKEGYIPDFPLKYW